MKPSSAPMLAPDHGEVFTTPELSRPYPIAARAFRQVEGDTTPDLTDFDRTDAAFAREFALAYRELVCYDWRLRAWRVWESHTWRLDQCRRALLLLQEHLEQKLVAAIADSRTKAARTEAIREITRRLGASHLPKLLDNLVAVQPDIARTGDEFDRAPLFNVSNGVIELHDGSCRPGRPADLLSLQSEVSFDPAAKCPRFQQFLVETLSDEELVAFVQRWFGYCLTQTTSEQVFLCYWGEGANGKSLLADVQTWLMGSYAITLPMATFTSAGNHPGSATPDLVRLPGKRLATALEASVRAKFDEARIKSLTGEDAITARPLYGGQFEFRPVARLLFVFNDRPRVSDLSHAFWRRALIVHFQRVFAEGERDEHLRAKLREEASGILNWALVGLREWQRIGLRPPASVRAAVEGWREDSDLVQEFIAEGCTPLQGAWTHARDLYAGFIRWCDLEGVPERERPGRKAFTARVSAFLPPTRRGIGNGFTGITPTTGVSK